LTAVPDAVRVVCSIVRGAEARTGAHVFLEESAVNESAKKGPEEGASNRKRSPRKKPKDAAPETNDQAKNEAQFSDREVPIPQPVVIAIEEEIDLPMEQVRMRAYLLYVERGFTPGNELEDWLQAERDVRAQQAKDKRSPDGPQPTTR
jgi:hypothetical protein